MWFDSQLLFSWCILTFTSAMLSFHAGACLDRLSNIPASQQTLAYSEPSHIVAFQLYDSYYYWTLPFL